MRDVVIDKLQLGFQARLHDYPAVAANMMVQDEADRFTNQIIYTVTTFLSNIHKQDKSKTSLFKYPATPWEFYKLKYAPAWFLERWPVRYVEEQVEVWNEKNFMCPHLATPPNDRYHVMWLSDAQDGRYNEPHRHDSW